MEKDPDQIGWSLTVLCQKDPAKGSAIDNYRPFINQITIRYREQTLFEQARKTLPLVQIEKVRLYVIIMSRTSFRVNLHYIVCLNVKELFSQSRHHIWSSGGSNVILSHNYLVWKRTLIHLAKLTIAKLVECMFRWTKWLWVRVPLLSLRKSKVDTKKVWFLTYDISGLQ